MKKEATANSYKTEREDMTLLHAPGYVYDLFFVFATYFNEELLANNLNDESNRRKEDFLDFLKNDIRPYFGEISDDLYVFFHSLEHGRCFVTTQYFRAEGLKDLSFDGFLEALSDKECFIRNLIKFYFYDIDTEVAKALAVSKEKVFPIIKNSEYSAEEKAKLYEFFLDSDYYIDLLIKQLKEKEKLLAKYYDGKYGVVTELFNNTTFESLSEQMEETQAKDFYKNQDVKFYLSVCILNKNLILHKATEDDAFIIIGCEYKECLKMGNMPDLKGLGCVLAEESRVKILAYMLQAGEVVCKDLEKNFRFSGSTAYHHLTMMCRVGIVKFRISKKTVLYSINRKYVDRILGVLLDYSSYKDVSEIK